MVRIRGRAKEWDLQWLAVEGEIVAQVVQALAGQGEQVKQLLINRQFERLVRQQPQQWCGIGGGRKVRQAEGKTLFKLLERRSRTALV